MVATLFVVLAPKDFFILFNLLTELYLIKVIIESCLNMLNYISTFKKREDEYENKKTV